MSLGQPLWFFGPGPRAEGHDLDDLDAETAEVGWGGRGSLLTDASLNWSPKNLGTWASWHSLGAVVGNARHSFGHHPG